MVDIANQQFQVPNRIKIRGIGVVPVPTNVKTQLDLQNFVKAYGAVQPSAAADVGNVALNALKNAPVNIAGSVVDTARMLQDVGNFAQTKAMGMAGIKPEMASSILESRQEPGIVNTLAGLPLGSPEIRSGVQNVTGMQMDYRPLTPTGEMVDFPLNSAMQVLASRNPMSLLSKQGALRAGRESLTAAGGAKIGETVSTGFDFGEYTPFIGAVTDIGSQAIMSRVGKVTAAKIAKKEAPTAEDFAKDSAKLWEKLDDMKARINPGTLKNEIKTLTGNNPEYLDPNGYPQTSYYINRLTGQKGPMSYSFKSLQNIRSDMLKDLRDGAVKGRERESLSNLIDSVDTAIESGSFQPTIGGTSPTSSQEIASLYKDARSMHRQLVKSDKIERILEQAPNEKNPKTYIQNEFRKILRNEKIMRAFSPEEIEFLKNPIGRSELAEKAANYISSTGSVGSIASGDLFSAAALKTAADITAGSLRAITRANPIRSAEETAAAIRFGVENLKKAKEAELLNASQRNVGLGRGTLASLYTQGLLGTEQDRR